MSRNTYLDELESRSIYIIREAYWEYKGNLALLWSMGKDSTVLLHLARKAFFGKIPFPTVHIDTGFKFKQIYDFRDAYAKKWRLDLLVLRNKQAMQENISPEKGRFNCCNALKTDALKQGILEHKFRALLVAIRRDEHAIRAKERYFSPRDENFRWEYENQPLELWMEYHKTEESSGKHFRVHPLLHWREVEVWEYIRREQLPVVSLYFAKKGKRFRSIGCACCCESISSRASTVSGIIKELQTTDIAERSGRVQDKEKAFMMQKLRSLGYM